ncbi:MAG: hypothetical protein N3F66_08550 [Spirochaetes bacterium]|nr:hypothetical protein [Spirochaetota bacterium]
MNIETTTCITLNHLDLLKQYAAQHKLSLHAFLVSLINYVVSYKKIPAKSYMRLKYRQRYNDWKRVHLYLYDHEYEFLMDVRKIFKMSLAKVISYCVENYLFDFLVALDSSENTDNYRYSGYTFSFYLEDGIPCCQFYWGPPPQIMYNQ